jgi:hypothetical protein
MGSGRTVYRKGPTQKRRFHAIPHTLFASGCDTEQVCFVQRLLEHVTNEFTTQATKTLLRIQNQIHVKIRMPALSWMHVLEEGKQQIVLTIIYSKMD